MNWIVDKRTPAQPSIRNEEHENQNLKQSSALMVHFKTGLMQTKSSILYSKPYNIMFRGNGNPIPAGWRYTNLLIWRDKRRKEKTKPVCKQPPKFHGKSQFPNFITKAFYHTLPLHLQFPHVWYLRVHGIFLYISYHYSVSSSPDLGRWPFQL